MRRCAVERRRAALWHLWGVTWWRVVCVWVYGCACQCVVFWKWVVRSFFFFSSRRRHTRLTCDWSSDVCSSDLLDRDGQVRLLHPVSVSRTPLTDLVAAARRADTTGRPTAARRR